jgi:hypothetical protein
MFLLCGLVLGSTIFFKLEQIQNIDGTDLQYYASTPHISFAECPFKASNGNHSIFIRSKHLRLDMFTKKVLFAKYLALLT